MAMTQEGPRTRFFAEMGTWRLLYLTEDKELLSNLSDRPLQPLLESDRTHGTEYLETLRMYLRHDGSIKAMAEEMYIHRNTILYRMAKIKELLGSSLETPQERVDYIIACMIQDMKGN